MYDRLYNCNTVRDGGTLMQLRNEIDRRNIGKDISKRFNASIDFFELATDCYITSAAMKFYGMNKTDEEPTLNALPTGTCSKLPNEQWQIFSKSVGKIIDRFVLVREHVFCDKRDTPPVPLEETISFKDRPHVARIAYEHGYFQSMRKKKSRNLPTTVTGDISGQDVPMEIVQFDELYNYGSAALNDGLLMKEFRSSIHAGDGERIARCWKAMLLYFHAYGHTNYALESFHFLAQVGGVVPPALQKLSCD